MSDDHRLGTPIDASENAPRRFWGRKRLREQPQGVELACEHCRRPFRALSERGRGGQWRRFCCELCKKAFYAAEQRSSCDEVSADDDLPEVIEARYQAAFVDIRYRRVKDLTP